MQSQPVRHVLLVKFRPGATDEAIGSVFSAFRAACRKIEGIVSFEYGANNSPEGRNRSLTHVIVLTFAGVQARDAYLPHPEHRAFAEWLGKVGIIEELVVIDYIPQS